MIVSKEYTRKQVPTFLAEIYIAGDANIIKQFIRNKAITTGMCVSIENTTFIYSGGEESGVVVRFINYPRLPWTNKRICTEAEGLARELIEHCGQMSATIVCSDVTIYLSRRPTDVVDPDDL